MTSGLRECRLRYDILCSAIKFIAALDVACSSKHSAPKCAEQMTLVRGQPIPFSCFSIHEPTTGEARGFFSRRKLVQTSFIQGAVTTASAYAPLATHFWNSNVPLPHNNTESLERSKGVVSLRHFCLELSGWRPT